ncbi:hypothetical protein [Streptomyces alkaliterrae]|uniref:Uncharacterized protein n=1 Tax=Streptomyces alkaliterrae TaxID=2213162 RepID=A0A5P0YXA7_9ACTN|nr:hypothetical protein [Streptomyces alkaliterrae]MBB1256597.1 hypothetical protein [Streptomyces alkaliterrae]MBB1261938.1 hypothetical protein [Streptomyces alkaliterrae]MQS04610.1 hypothetical protein [Streptomyces alkaliterrae]
MPEYATTHRPCGHCDGQATAAITTGRTNPDGTRHTLTATCPRCKGTGTAPARALASAIARR